MSVGFDLDVASASLTALTKVVELMRLTTDACGQGVMECPRCKGKLRYAWMRARKRVRTRGAQSYKGVCDTEGCVQFSGH